MKVFKRLAAIVLVIMLMSALMMPVSAAGNKTITINNADAGHSFEAYQIFDGDISNGILANLQWGEGVVSATLISKLQAASGFSTGISFAGCDTPDEIAAVLEADEWKDADTDVFAKIVAESLNAGGKKAFSGSGTSYTVTVPIGYYFIKDATADHNTHAYTKYIICLTTDTSVTPKTAVPTMTKYVSHKADSEFDEALSASVGDYVYFKLTANLKDRTDDYPEYYIQFVETLPAGLTYDSVVSVKASGIAIETSEYGFAAAAAAKVDGQPQEVTFTLAQAKTAIRTETGREVLEGDTIEIVFKAKVNEHLIVNTTSGNESTAYMKFSNDPNIAVPSDSLSQTVVHRAKVYAYGIAVDKIDATNPTKKLGGAKFKIYRNGTGGDEYAQANGAGVVTGWTTTEGNATEFTTNEFGAFTVKGLGKNTYYLKETLAPAGYNSLKSIPTISFVASFDRNTGAVTGFSGSVVGHGVADLKSVDNDAGIVTVTVKNTIGATLPQTGGMGTTVFYLGGLVLVLGAAVLLISRKRKGAEG